MNIIIHGSDVSRVRKKIQVVKQKYKIETPSIVFDATEVDQREILVEMDSFSIFDEAKIIVIENCTFLTGKDTTKYDIQPFIERSNKDVECIVVFSVYSDKLDQRKKAVKELASKSEVITCIALDEKSKPTFINDICKKLELQLDYEAMDYFKSRMGLDSDRIENELVKLRTYNSFITLEDAKALVCSEPMNDVFKMVNALFDKNALLFLAYYRNFRELNMEPLAINGLLSSQIRFLFQVRYCMDYGMGKEEIASKLKAHPYRIQMTMKRASLFSCEELLEQLEALANLDQNIKMGKIDKDEGFEMFAFDLLKENLT